MTYYDGFVAGVGLFMLSYILFAVLKYVYLEVKFQKAYKKYAHAEPHTRECDRHEWEDVTLAVKQLPIDKYKVCTNCGYISGTDMQMNEPGMAQIAETRQLLAKRKAYEDYLRERRDNMLEHKCITYVDQNVLNFCEAASDENTELIRVLMKDLFKYANKQQEEVINKIAEEEKHQADLDRRYAGWGKS